MNSFSDPAQTAVSLAPIAEQYGPFFFTVFYTLIVLVLGQEIIKRRLSGASDLPAVELEERIRSQRAYRTFAISMAGFCLTFSLFWWGYVQIYPPRDTIEALVKDQIGKKVFQGQITGLSAEDRLLPYDNNHYTVYMETDTNAIPMMSKFVIIAKDKPIFGNPITVYYGNDRAIQSAKLANVGYSYQPLHFCLNDNAAEMQITKAQDGAPLLSNPCDTKVKQ